MIGVGAPLILGAAFVGALATCVLHFLSVRRPPVLLLPTMRFLPERPVRAVSRSARPSDLWLLVLRVSALLLIGAALGGLYWRASGVKHGRVVLIQRGTGADNLPGARDAVSRALRGAFAPDTATRIVLMDTVAHVLSAAQSRAFNYDSIADSNAHVTRPVPTLTAAILAATRAASALVREERDVDAVDLVIVAPLLRDMKDAALPSVRALWPGVVRFNNSNVVADSTRPYQRRVALIGAKPSEAVESALETRGWVMSGGGGSANVGPANAARTTGASKSEPDNPVTIEWPASGTPDGWTESAPAVVGAVVARGEALVFPFQRTSRIPDAVLARGRALAWWSDGEVAAVEIPTATSCTRHVGIPIPAFSDVLLGQAARALLFAVSAPCGGERETEQLSADELRALSGTGSAASASAFRSASVAHTPFAPLLLTLGIALLLAEWWVRDREDRINSAIDVRTDPVRKVA